MHDPGLPKHPPVNPVDSKGTGQLILERGNHPPDDGVCLLEAVAREAKEPHSDHPHSVCPVIAAYGRELNDQMPDDVRQRLIPFIARLVGTRSTKSIEQKRMYLCADWAVRRFAPAALDAAGLSKQAATLRALTPITDKKTAAEAAWAARAAAAGAAAAGDDSIALLEALINVHD